VLFAIDRAGLVGGDGPTHAGAYDVSYLRCLPHLVLMTPADENETRQMLYTGFLLDGPAAVRYPRGTGPGVAVERELEALPIGKAQLRRRGKGIAFLAFGPMVAPAAVVAEQLDATLVNMRFVKPLDEEMVLSLAEEHDLLVTVDENAVQGGAGSAVNECLLAHDRPCSVLNLGLPDRFIEQGSRGDMLRDAGLDPDGILAALERFCARPEHRRLLARAIS
jgi:1-deoxy-D-xylulose-5-phosphate synthase